VLLALAFCTGPGADGFYTRSLHGALPIYNEFKCGWCSFQEHCEYWNPADDLEWLESSGANKFLDKLEKDGEDEK